MNHTLQMNMNYSPLRMPVGMHTSHASSIRPFKAGLPAGISPGRRSHTLRRHSAGRLSHLVGTRASASDGPALQLATAKLPKDVSAEAFMGRLFDWASTMTSSGRNLPFALPLRTRKAPGGFEISLLRINHGEPVAVGSIVATIEAESGVGNILFVRFREGEGAQLVRSRPLPEDSQERLKTVIDGLVDVPLIMDTMKQAIRQAVVQSK